MPSTLLSLSSRSHESTEALSVCLTIFCVINSKISIPTYLSLVFNILIKHWPSTEIIQELVGRSGMLLLAVKAGGKILISKPPL